MNNVISLLGFTLNLKNFFPKPSEEILLDPLTTIFRLSILSFKDPGTKLSIKDNQIQHQSYNVLQGILRWSKGDTKEILGNLHKPICLYLTKYTETPCDKILSNYAILGMKKLKDTYKKYNLIEHSLQHYIKLLENKNVTDELTEQDLKYYEMYDIWRETEVKLCCGLLMEYSKSNQKSTLKALVEILDGKDVLLREMKLT